jgi:hypothetical protein
MRSDGSFEQIQPDGEEQPRVQQTLIRQWRGGLKLPNRSETATSVT